MDVADPGVWTMKDGPITARSIVPDVTIMRRQVREAPVAYAAAPTTVLELPRQQPTPTIDNRISTDPILHRFVEIRASRRNHKLVTLIETSVPPTSSQAPTAALTGQLLAAAGLR
jgi:hypothetical protein